MLNMGPVASSNQHTLNTSRVDTSEKKKKNRGELAESGYLDHLANERLKYESKYNLPR